MSFVTFSSRQITLKASHVKNYFADDDSLQDHYANSTRSNTPEGSIIEKISSDSNSDRDSCSDLLTPQKISSTGSQSSTCYDFQEPNIFEIEYDIEYRTLNL